MIGAEYEKGVIALACWRAGRADNATGMIAVACVIRNRCSAGWNGSSAYLNAVSLPEMSSSYEDNGEMYPDSREPQFQTFLQMLDSVLYGLAKDATGGGLYYADGPGRTRVSTLGKMTFYA